MNLLDIVHRPPPRPWIDGEKIPWNEPEFSQRMLREHLSQAHDAASRRFEIIDAQVAWIHGHLLGARPARVLDLACGPGLYLNRLARRGHTGMGIDFSPAAVAYAKAEAVQDKLAVTYQLGDVRTTEFGSGYDLAMLLFGEINVFRRAAVAELVGRAYAALQTGGCLLLEPTDFKTTQSLGERPAQWYAVASGLFSPRPHICLSDNAWDATECASVERHTIIDAESGDVRQYGGTTVAYTDDELATLLRAAGFARVESYPSLLGVEAAHSVGLPAIVAWKV